MAFPIDPQAHFVDIVAYTDVVMGNPNGDPDDGNRPRQNADDDHGFITDVAIKRKVRDYVERTVEAGLMPAEGNAVYVAKGVPSETVFNSAIAEDGQSAADVLKAVKADPDAKGAAVVDTLCGTFYDVRAFGSVLVKLSKADPKHAHVQGPVQVAFSDSIDAINPQNVSIARCAVATEREAADGKASTFGDKWVVPYGRYKTTLTVSPGLAKQTGFDAGDLETLLEALLHLWDQPSSANPKSGVVKIVVLEHSSSRRNCGIYQAINAVKCPKLTDRAIPASPEDYGTIEVDKGALPDTVTVWEYGYQGLQAA